MNWFKRPKRVEFPSEQPKWVELPHEVTTVKEILALQRQWNHMYPDTGPCAECVALDKSQATARALLEATAAKLGRTRRTGPHGYVFKRDGFWVSNVYGSDGALCLYDEVFAMHRSWETMMDGCRSDIDVAIRCEIAGHILPAYDEVPTFKHH